jgi:hypothetical protein
MTLQTHFLEARLGQLQAKVQRVLADGLAVDTPKAVDCWQALDALALELNRALRQFEGLAQQHAQLLVGLSAASPDQRGRENPGLFAFENDLARVQRGAGVLAATIVELRRRSGDALSVDLAQAVCHIGMQMGRSLDQLMVRRTVQQISMQPSFVPVSAPTSAAKLDASSVVETVFVAIGMVLALIQGRGLRNRA